MAFSATTLIDTYPAFLKYWADAQERPAAEQLERWRSVYLAPWPELAEKQIQNYAEQQADWRQVARERILPFLAGRAEAMRVARDNLLELGEAAVARAHQILGWDAPVTLVIHVGIGCGAGWAATFQNRPAVLLGLENIAEEGWHAPAALRGLLAHEIGHLAHFDWRARQGLPKGSGPWWDLYTEGFAQRCESLVSGEEWHISVGKPGWRNWCRGHRHHLAAEFLRLVERGESTRPFFGSWHTVDGVAQTGYYLGYEVIRRLEAAMTLREIALIESSEPAVRAALVEICQAHSACPT